MDALNKWFTDMTDSPAGSILLFILVFLARVSIDRWDRRRQAKRKRPPKAGANA